MTNSNNNHGKQVLSTFVEDIQLWGEIGCSIGYESQAGDSETEYTGDQWEPDDDWEVII